jgi:hypothetical protein
MPRNGAAHNSVSTATLALTTAADWTPALPRELLADDLPLPESRTEESNTRQTWFQNLASLPLTIRVP